ncbi:MFS transporter [Cohnella hongkongensis]|uniref:MFS transporter n=1 Tax=Cohnella hongkongensis TaxID=178337 RepID=A0ABV9F6I5_9BACL
MAGFVGILISYALFTAAMYAGLHGAAQGGMLIGSLILTRSMIGAFIPAVPSASQAYMADITDTGNRSAGMALIGAANGLGLVLGPAVAGGLAMMGLLWPLYAGTLLPLVALAAIALLVPKRSVLENGAKASAAAKSKPPRLNPFQPGVRLYLSAGFVMMLAIVTLQVVGGFYFQDQLMIGTKEAARLVSFGLMISGASMLLVQALLMKLASAAPGPRTMLLAGGGLIVLGMGLLLAGSSLAVLYLAYLAFGIGAGLMMPGFMTGASLSVSAEQQGGVAGLVGLIQGLSGVAAPLLATALYNVDRHLPFAVIGALLLLLVLIMLVLPGRALSDASPTASTKADGAIEAKHQA